MKKKSWTSVYTNNEDTQALKTVPPPLPHKPCRDPKRHKILSHYLVEYGGPVCLWCDPEHANAWGYIIDDCLCREKEHNQLALVQELRREEEEKARKEKQA